MTGAELKVSKSEEYMAYINAHVENVKRAYNEIKSKCMMIEWIAFAITFIDTTSRINEHDLSKYSDEEFEPYRMKFYPCNEEESAMAESAFEDAWKHHYTVNDHHWEYWLDENKNPRDMSDESIIEMCSDWQGMSYKFGGNAKEWFSKQTDIILSPSTLNKVNELLNTLCE